MDSKPPTRFCSTCGTLMGRKKKINGYSEFNGKPEYDFIFRCPRQRFWGLGHASITITPNYNDYSSQSGD